MLRSVCFNPRAPCGARRDRPFVESADMEFQSTRPMRGATSCAADLVSEQSRVSIHAPHAGRDGRNPLHDLARPVSIHAPHAGRDLRSDVRCHGMYRFNPRAPCGARPLDSRVYNLACMFQSTRPMRGATVADTPFLEHIIVSIHAPHAGRDAAIIPY